MTPRQDEELSPVMRGLRTGGDEVQFAMVLANLCGGSPRCATKFVTGLLSAVGTNAESGTKATDLTVHGEVTCIRESGVVGYGRGTVRRQAKKLGSVDLLFRDESNLRLYCELKINASYQPGQIPRYIKGAGGSHVVSVVRTPMLKDSTVTDPRWLGEVTWGEMLDVLKVLPVSSQRIKEQWLDLLAIMERDEDFAAHAPTGAAERDLEFVKTVTRRVLRHLRKKLCEESDPRAAMLADELTASDPFSTYQGRWARVDLSDEDEIAYLRISARHVESGAGQLRITWVPWDEPASLVRDQAGAHKRLLEDYDCETTAAKTPRYTYEKPIGGGSYERKVKTATTYGKDAADALLELRLLDPDIEEFESGPTQ